MKARNFLWFFSLFFLVAPLHAREYSDLQRVAELSRNYLKQQVMRQQPNTDSETIRISSNRIDTRLKLRQCDEPLTFSHRRNITLKGTTSIKVSCHSPSPWAIYTKHRIQIERKILIAKHTLAKGHIINENDLSYIKRDMNNQRSGIVVDKDLVLGRQVARQINAGQMIYHRQLSNPQLVKKGDKVNLVAKIGSLSVVTPGIAMSNGSLGDQIDIKNQRSSRIIRAEVTGQNSAEVIL